MKTLQAVVILAILGVSLSVKFTEEILSPRDWECIKEIGIDVQAALNCLNDDYTITARDPKAYEYTVCYYKKANAIDENNEIKFDVMKTEFVSFIELTNKVVADKDQAASNAVEFCKNVEGDNLGDRLMKFGNCVVKYIEKL